MSGHFTGVPLLGTFRYRRPGDDISLFCGSSYKVRVIVGPFFDLTLTPHPECTSFDGVIWDDNFVFFYACFHLSSAKGVSAVEFK